MRESRQFFVRKIYRINDGAILNEQI